MTSAIGRAGLTSLKAAPSSKTDAQQTADFSYGSSLPSRSTKSSILANAAAVNFGTTTADKSVNSTAACSLATTSYDVSDFSFDQPLISQGKTSILAAAGAGNLSTSRVINEIAKKNYRYCDDSDEDDDPGAEGYLIDPSIQLYKSIDFSRNKPKEEHTEPKERTERAERVEEKRLPRRRRSAEKSQSMTTTADFTPPSFATAGQTILGDGSSRLNQAAGMTVGDSSSGEIEELKRSLDRLAREKIEAENMRRMAEKSALEFQGNVNEQMRRQQDELRHMMESMQRDRDQMALMAKLAEAEKAKAREETDKKAKKERDALMEALELMKAQNAMLVGRIEQTQNESRELLAKEREERISAVKRMEQDNQLLTQQLLHAQAEAERNLSREKNELRAALKRMEQEKAELRNRINATEDLARSEKIVLDVQRAEFQKSLQRLETEKKQLASRVEENGRQSQAATEAVKEQLAQEKLQLQQRIAKMEAEKAELAQSLASSEQMVKAHADELAHQLAQERDELRKNLERMEAEKRDLSQHLKATEKQAQEQAAALVEQIAKDKSEVLTAMTRMEQEKAMLSNRIAENESQVQKASDSMAEQLRKERSLLEAQVEALAKEKEDLAVKLSLTEEAAKEREALIADRMTKEREDLKSAVQRMKEEILAERRAAEANGTVSASLKGAGGSGSNLNLKPTKSLYDLMEDGDKKVIRKMMSKEVVVPRTINMIPEGDEGGGEFGESFMNVEDEDSDEEGEGDKGDDPFSDLPAPHAAAASGDLARLKMFGGLEASLLSSFDAANRSPLFYAAAYGKLEVAEYLAEMCPTAVQVADVHGDTPLHAAASAGATECVEMLCKVIIDKSDGKTDPRNHMGMSPAHLSSSQECLALLYKYGADMGARDDNGRTPLFVACAMNRVECAEFLVNCLDQSEASLLTMDNRGDTPLHAAACNGSVDCLLLLLQFGVDPMHTNQKGLKALDLAIRNKQKICKQLLVEYHIHFNTSSEFDSVLFLATLEGHKRVRDLGKHGKGGGEDEAYHIIKKHSIEPGKEEHDVQKADKVMTRVQSLFSLRHGKSLRLQRWGAWIAYEDQLAQKVYWYNHHTSAGQWEKPEEVARLQLAASRNEGSSRTLNAKMSMRLKKIGDWIQYLTEGGQTFYYNDKTGEFQWISPETDPEGASKEATSDWKPYKDPETGSIFWYNTVTQVSQWECPMDQAAGAAATAPAEAGGGGWDGEENEAVSVYHEDDLGI